MLDDSVLDVMVSWRETRSKTTIWWTREAQEILWKWSLIERTGAKRNLSFNDSSMLLLRTDNKFEEAEILKVYHMDRH